MLKAKVRISCQTHQNYKLLIWFFRVILVFPFTILETTSNCFIQFSPVLALLGAVYGLILIFMAYWGIYLDVGGSKEESIRVTSDADRFMYINDVTGYAAVFFCGVILNPLKFKQFFSFVRYLNQVDSIIRTSHKKTDRRSLQLILFAIVLLNMILFWSDLSDDYLIFGDKASLIDILQRYVAMDIIAGMSNLIEYTNRILLHSLEKRIKRLNELLEVEYLQMNTLGKISLKNAMKLNFMEKNRIMAITCGNCAGNAFANLSQAYVTIMDAADMLNDFLGPSTLVSIVTVVWALIESPYFFILAFTGKRGDVRDAIEVPGALLVLIFHFSRVLLITEPSYACLMEIEVTKNLVCKLLSCSVNQTDRKQLCIFAKALELRKLKFAPYGLFTVDRVLFTSLLDTITTLLVILLQYRDEIQFDM